MTYRIIPLILSRYVGEKGYMTFLTDYGVPIVRPFIMWYIQGAEKENHCGHCKVDIVIQTHLHFDHCYNTRKCVNAKVFVQEDELKFAQNPVPFEGIYRKELLEGLSFEIIKGDFRLFEGIDLLFTPGHSAGGQSVCVQTDKGKAVISGLCGIKENYYPENINPMAGGGTTILPGIMLDAVKAYHSIIRIKEAADIILPLHDPEILKMKSIP